MQFWKHCCKILQNYFVTFVLILDISHQPSTSTFLDEFLFYFSMRYMWGVKKKKRKGKRSGKKLLYQRLAQRNHRVHTCSLVVSFYNILRLMDNFALFCDEILQEIGNLLVENFSCLHVLTFSQCALPSQHMKGLNKNAGQCTKGGYMEG